MMPSYNLARMSGMLDLSRDEKAKHFLPRWLRDAPTWIKVVLLMMRKRSWNLSEVSTVNLEGEANAWNGLVQGMSGEAAARDLNSAEG